MLLIFIVYQGRDPITSQLDLENSQVQTELSGKIIVDDLEETTARGIFAIGDVAEVNMNL